MEELYAALFDDGASNTTVKKWWTRWQAEGDLYDYRRRGSPGKTNEEFLKKLQGHIMNIVQIHKQLQS